jgi:hypothetical protein
LAVPYVITGSQYLKFDDVNNTWIVKGAPPTSTSTRLRFLGSLGPATLSWAHTVGDGSERLLVVGILYNGQKLQDVNDVTFTVGADTRHLARLGSEQGLGQQVLDIWYLRDPAVGTGTIMVTFVKDGPAVRIATSMSFTSAGPDTLALSEDANTGMAASLSMPAAAGDTIANFVGVEAGTVSAGPGQAEKANFALLGTRLGAALKGGTAPATSLTWNLSEETNWVLAAVRIPGGAMFDAVATASSSGSNGLLYHCTGNNDAGGNGSLRRSTDGGDTWVTLAPPAAGYQIIAYDRAPDSRLWAVWKTALTGISQSWEAWYSDDLGDSWTYAGLTQSTLGALAAREVACHPTNNSAVAIAVSGSTGAMRAFVTLDRGTSWAQTGALNSGLMSPGSFETHVIWGSPADTQPLAATGPLTFYGYSTDLTTWTSARASMTIGDIFVALDRLGVGTTLLSVLNRSASSLPPQVYRSHDGGQTWTAYTAPQGTLGQNVLAMAVHPEADALFAVASDQKVWQASGAQGGDFLADKWTVLPTLPTTLSTRMTLAAVDGDATVKNPDDGTPIFPPESGTPPAPSDGSGGATRPAGTPLSRVFDTDLTGTPGEDSGQPDGAPQQLISLVDRLPPGQYGIARGDAQPYGGYINAAVAAGMRGIVFVLGDSDLPPVNDFPGGPDTPEPRRALGLRWQPDPNGHAWQRHQFDLDADLLKPNPNTGTVDPEDGQLAGPQAARNAHLVVGGMFICGKGAFDRPAQAAAMIASTANRLSLDFVLIDIDTKLPDGGYVWAQQRARDKILTLAAHVQQRFIQPPRSPHAVEISAHKPVLIVLPPSPTGFDNLLSSDQVHKGTFPPLTKEYTSPVTFPAPRLGGSSGTDLVAAWQWVRPVKVGAEYIGMTQMMLVVDVRSGGDTSFVNAALTDGGVAVSFPGQSKIWTPRCGMVIWDDLDHVNAISGAEAKYWDLDGEDGHCPYVPAMHPDPPPIGIVNKPYEAWVDERGRTISESRAAAINDRASTSDGDSPPAGAVRLPFNIWFENWKTGHRANEEGLPIQKFLPRYFEIRDKVCGDLDTREAVPSWIRVNGRWMTPIGGPDKKFTFWDENMNGRLVFSGTPVTGDEGLYALGITAASNLSIGPVTTIRVFITVTNPSQQEDAERATTGIKMIRSDIGDRDGTENFRDASQLHPTVPIMYKKDVDIVPTSNPFNPDFCAAIAPVLPKKPIELPARPPQAAVEQTQCGSFMSDVIVAAQMHCMLNNVTPFGVAGVCGICGDQTLYLAFVAYAAQRISDFNPSYRDGCHVGLFGVPDNTCGGRFTAQQLTDPAFNFDVAADMLEAAFADTAPSFCGGKACPAGWTPAERVGHAFMAYLELAGISPGIHGPVGPLAVHDPPCAKLVNQPIDSIQCFIDNINAGLATPGRNGGAGQPTPGGTGGGEGGGAGGGTGGGAGVDTQFTPGCPRTGLLTADCAWHWANEGIPAIDIACNTGDYLYSPCDGRVTYRGLDPFARPRFGLTPPNHLLGLGIETRVLCDNGMEVRFGHQQKMPLESFCKDNPDDPRSTEFLKESWASCFDSACPDTDPNRNKGCSQCCNQDETPGKTTITRCQGCPSPGKICVPCTGHRVTKGFIIGLCDSTGYSFGPHLHYETWVGGGPGTGGHRICPLETLPVGCPS